MLIILEWKQTKIHIPCIICTGKLVCYKKYIEIYVIYKYKIYVGQTGRNFDVRLKEHKSAVRLGNMNNACAKHSANKNHLIDWKNAKPVYMSGCLSKRLVVESALIKTSPNFNNMASSTTIENLAARSIIKANKGLKPPD